MKTLKKRVGMGKNQDFYSGAMVKHLFRSENVGRFYTDVLKTLFKKLKTSE